METISSGQWRINRNPADAPSARRAPAELTALFAEYKELVDIPSTSGFEQGVASYLCGRFRELCDDVHVDTIGNVYGFRRGRGPIVLFVAHSDSCGFITQTIDPDGYVYFANQGVVPPYNAYGQRVEIVTEIERITGVIGTKPGHATFNFAGGEGYSWPSLCDDGGTGVPMFDEMFIDVGASSREAVLAMGIRPGQQVVWDRELRWLGDGSSGFVSGRGQDDKCGIQALIEMLKGLVGRELPCTVAVVAACQEEVGLRGAINAGSLLNPDICIGVDGGIASSGPGSDLPFAVGRSPGMSSIEAPEVTGAGVYVAVADVIWAAVGGLIGNQRVNQHLLELAVARGIPHQLEGNCRYITSDPAAIQFSGAGGTPSVTLKIPVRYTHGPVEVISLHDVVAASRLAVAFVEEIDSLDLAFIDAPEADRGVVKRRVSYLDEKA